MRRNRIIINFDNRMPGGGRSSRRRGRGLAAVLLGIAFILVLIAAGIAGGGYLWWRHYQSSPAYSLALLVDAIQRDDQQTIDQLLDFFNADPPFIPVRTNIMPRPILLQKNAIVSVDLIQMKNQLQEGTSMRLAEKREAIFYMQATGPMRGSVILELPLDHARIIDLLNQKRMFIPVQIHEKFMLLNSHHINKIEEL